MVTMPIKNFLSHVKTRLSSLLLSSLICTCSSMTLNYRIDNSACMSLNCQGPSSCMTINCPLCCTVQSCVLSHDGPCDSPTVRLDDTMYCASLQTCPDLDLLSSTDSTQTHDSLATSESPHYSSSPSKSLEEGTHTSQNHTRQ